MPDSSGFSETLLQAVDEGLGVPGEVVRAAIYERIEKSYQLKREEIPNNLPTFQKALEDLLGSAAQVMQRLIAKNLHRRLGLNFEEHRDWMLADYVNHAKKATGRS